MPIVQRDPYIAPETRLIDMTVAELLLVIRAENTKLLKDLPAKEEDPYFDIAAFKKYFNVEHTSIQRMRKDGLPFDGKGQRSRILKSEAIKWWKDHGSKYIIR